MSATKLLNIDTLTGEQRTIVLGGKEYAVEEMSVDNFLETTKAAESLQDSRAGLSAQVESAIDLILRCVPGVPRDTLKKVALRNLQTIVAFVRGDEVEAVAEPELPSEKAGKVAPGAKNRRARK